MEPIIGYLDGADIGVIIAYFVIIFAVGIWVCSEIIYMFQHVHLVIPSESWFGRWLFLGWSFHALDTCRRIPLCQ